jgi:non-ribosomal peptide synthetase component E (peptide arylation enzyme)
MPGVVYPPAEVLGRYVAAGLLGHTTLAEAFMAAHAAHAERPALVGPEGHFSHAQLDAITDRVAAAFLDFGLQPTDRVVIQLPNCNELVFVLLGCFKAGLIPVCSLVPHRECQIAYLSVHAEARLHVVLGEDPEFDHVAFSHRIRADAPSIRHTVVARGPARAGALSLKDLCDAQDPELARRRVLAVSRDPFQVGLFQLSAGTCGVPKIVPRFSSEYVYNMRAMGAWLEYDSEDCWYNPMPIAHNFNLVCCTGPVLLAGGSVAMTPTMDLASMASLLQEQQPTWMALPGPVLTQLRPMLSSGELTLQRARGILSSNSAKLIEELTGVSAFHNFGMAECVILSTHPDDPIEARHRTVGRPISEYDEVRILRPGTEESMPDGQTGEAAFRGSYTTHGYYDAAERNAEAFTSDGFYRSGDLMSKRPIDGKAYFVYEGRI